MRGPRVNVEDRIKAALEAPHLWEHVRVDRCMVVWLVKGRGFKRMVFFLEARGGSFSYRLPGQTDSEAFESRDDAIRAGLLALLQPGSPL